MRTRLDREKVFTSNCEVHRCKSESSSALRRSSEFELQRRWKRGRKPERAASQFGN